METTEIKLENNRIVLTEEQRKKILTLVNINPEDFPNIRDLQISIFPDKKPDGRSLEAKAIKEYLATLNVKTKSTYNPKYDERIELDDGQKLYVRNNALTMSITEMARALFNKESISKINLEYKAIEELVNKEKLEVFDPTAQTNNSVKLPLSRSRMIPKTLEQAAKKVNQYVRGAIDIKELKKNTRVQNYLQALIRFCHKVRYGLMINTLANSMDLELFESTFISNVWDKPDLSEEEIDQNINLCCDIVNYTKMQREVEKMTEMRDKCLDDSEGKRLSMSLVQQMAELYKEMDNNLKRQNATTKVLIGTRNDRMEGQKKGAMSVSQLIEAWRDKQKRERLISLAEKRKELVKGELERLDSLDSFKVEIWGLNKESF